jgi:hypothetical protein
MRLRASTKNMTAGDRVVCAFEASAGRPPFEVREVRGLYFTHMSVAVCSKRKTQGLAALTSHESAGADDRSIIFARAARRQKGMLQPGVDSVVE